MADILEFTGNTVLPEDPSILLEKAKLWGMKEVLVLGFVEDGSLTFGGSHCEIAPLILMLELAKKKLLASADD